jgi:hypothetical protein
VPLIKTNIMNMAGIVVNHLLFGNIAGENGRVNPEITTLTTSLKLIEK